jgi:hypothetical protein
VTEYIENEYPAWEWTSSNRAESSLSFGWNALEFGGHEHKWEEYDYAGGNTQSWTPGPADPYHPVGSYSATRSKDDHWFRLVHYLDIRSGTVIYNEQYTDSSNYTETFKESVTYSNFMVTTSDIRDYSDPLILHHRSANKITLNAVAPAGLDYSSDSVGPRFRSIALEEAQSSTTVDPEVVGQQSWGQPALDGATKNDAGHVGLAEDGAGNVLCSISKLSKNPTHPQGVEVYDEYINYLTGGDPIALSGLSGSNPYLDLIAVVKY